MGAVSTYKIGTSVNNRNTVYGKITSAGMRNGGNDTSL